MKLKTNNNLKDLIGKVVVIYSDTLLFELGAVVRVLDFDSITDSEPSFSVIELQKETSLSEGFNYNPTAEPKWVKQSDIKEVLSFNRKVSFLSRMKQWLTQGLKLK